MLQSRRGFLIGGGALLTTAFVKDARSFIRQTGQPLLATPRQVAQTMYWCENEIEGFFQLTLGRWSMTPPPTPTWREFFAAEGIPHQTRREMVRLCEEHCIEPGDFDKRMSERYWSDHFECVGSPLAKAYHLLRNIDLGPEAGSKPGPLLEFHEGDNHPGSITRWVNATDQLSLSLLQARLIDLKLPIKLMQDE